MVSLYWTYGLLTHFAYWTQTSWFQFARILTQKNIHLLDLLHCLMGSFNKKINDNNKINVLFNASLLYRYFVVIVQIN